MGCCLCREKRSERFDSSSGIGSECTGKGLSQACVQGIAVVAKAAWYYADMTQACAQTAELGTSFLSKQALLTGEYKE